MTARMDRRQLLAAGFGLAGLALAPARASGGDGGALYAAASKDASGRFAAVLFDLERQREVARVVLPERGHDLAVRPADPGGAPGEIVAFARRPGTFAVAFGPGRATPLWFSARADRYFYGHGVFSPDGRLLYTTENDFGGGVGVIGVRDATDGYRQIGELPAGGIGSHDIALLGDGRTLVVANGGIRTHPATPRLELNIPTMQPSLVYIDSRTGDLLEQHALPAALHQLSIRHLGIGSGDRIVFGCQFRGNEHEAQALVGLSRRGRALQLLAAPADVVGRMRNYVASVGVDRRGEMALVTAPLGNMAVAFEIASGRFAGEMRLETAFGVAPRGEAGGFLLTGGTGLMAEATCGSEERARIVPQRLAAAWDDHLVAVG